MANPVGYVTHKMWTWLHTPYKLFRRFPACNRSDSAHGKVACLSLGMSYLGRQALHPELGNHEGAKHRGRQQRDVEDLDDPSVVQIGLAIQPS